MPCWWPGVLGGLGWTWNAQIEGFGGRACALFFNVEQHVLLALSDQQQRQAVQAWLRERRSNGREAAWPATLRTGVTSLTATLWSINAMERNFVLSFGRRIGHWLLWPLREM